MGEGKKVTKNTFKVSSLGGKKIIFVRFIATYDKLDEMT